MDNQSQNQSQGNLAAQQALCPDPAGCLREGCNQNRDGSPCEFCPSEFFVESEQPNTDTDKGHQAAPQTGDVHGSTGRTAAVSEAPYSLYHVDDCMYVAAMSAEDAAAYVRAECGEGCGESVEPASLGMKVEMANLDDGEKPTKDSKKTARELIEEHLRFGGTLPDTICFDSGM